MNSDDLSAGIRAAAPPRKQIRLTGPTVALKSGRHAVRRDLAELAVADRVFAQHYAEPMAVSAKAAGGIHARPDAQSDTVGALAAGDVFQLLDVGQSWAWGRGAVTGSVGYVEASVLDLP